MGFNTAVIILNDCLNDLAKAPDAGQAILDAINDAEMNRRGAEWGYGRYGVVALRPVHADATQIVAVGGNHLRTLALATGRRPSDEQLLKALAAKLGYRVVKKTLQPGNRDFHTFPSVDAARAYLREQGLEVRVKGEGWVTADGSRRGMLEPGRTTCKAVIWDAMD